jgi:hypothetical protein
LLPLNPPRLELSGPKLQLALESLAARADQLGGVEAYVEALRMKSAMFREALAAGMDLKAFRVLCAHIATVRRRIGRYAEPEAFPQMKAQIDVLFSKGQDVDARLLAFCAGFPDDREHRWVRDLAAELLHYGDAERYPLMTRWMWDARANTGVLREIWHDDNVDHITIDVPDTYATFVVLREELAQYLSANGVFRDVLLYVDILAAQVYADYIGERGGSYLRADFATPEDPMVHVRRILGLDAVNPNGRSRLKALDRNAEILE